MVLRTSVKCANSSPVSGTGRRSERFSMLMVRAAAVMSVTGFNARALSQAPAKAGDQNHDRAEAEQEQPQRVERVLETTDGLTDLQVERFIRDGEFPLHDSEIRGRPLLPGSETESCRACRYS